MTKLGERKGSVIFAACPICGARQWINKSLFRWTCEGDNNKLRHTNVQRYKHSKGDYSIRVEEYITKEFCAKSKIIK